MYEKMNCPLPDINAYLERIGIKEPGKPDLDFLNRLIFAHQTHIPFEALDVWYYKKDISLKVPDLFDKMVTRKRGGFCFEQNLMLLQALKTLGFDAYPVFSRIFWFLTDDEIPPCSHCSVIVNLPEGAFFCDVGFGGPEPQSALPVFDGSVIEEPDALWKIVPYDDQWFTLCRIGSEGRWQYVLQFNLFKQLPQEFIALCNYHASSENSYFRQALLVNLRTENGSRSITESTYTEREGHTVTTAELASWEETLKVLEEKFGIVL